MMSSPGTINRMKRISTTTASLLLIVAACAGCSRSLNSAAGSLNGPHLPALQPDAMGMIADGPVQTDLDRRDWPVVTITVATRQTEHYPVVLRTRHWLMDEEQRSRYPTASSALDTMHDPSVVAADAALELVALPVGFVMNIVRTSSPDGPFAADRSPLPDESFQRRPAQPPEYARRWIVEPNQQ